MSGIKRGLIRINAKLTEERQEAPKHISLHYIHQETLCGKVLAWKDLINIVVWTTYIKILSSKS